MPTETPAITAIETDAEFAKRFAELTATWRERTRHSSKIGDRLKHPAFREVVAMGERAVPLILADLQKNGGFGFLPLGEITGIDPLANENHVNNDQLAAAWLAWGLAKGYRWEHAV